MEFPEQFISLTKLRDLDVSDNQIKKVPEKLLSLSPLHLFIITNNPINFSNLENEDVANVLYEISQKGVIVSPRINRDLVTD